MTPKVSILIPVYNVSKYIERCARSLFEQTFHDLEYIFVDDASPDNSIEILKNVLKEYPKRINQVKIITHVKNMGLAVTRNTALEAAKGDYISVVDSDDYVETHMIEELYNFAILENADIVVFNFEIEYNNRTEIISDNISANKEDYYIKVLTEENSHNLFNKLVKTKFYKLKECRVPEGLNYHEDFYVYIRLAYFANTIKKIDKVYYHYVYINNQSITKKFNEMHFENTVRLWNLTDKFLVDNNLYEKYKLLLDYPKVNRKIRLMIDTYEFRLRRIYVDIFSDEEKRCSHLFSKGEQRFLWLLRHRLFIVFWALKKAIVLKGKITITLKNICN